MLKSLTPLITVQSIEPCLPFWTEGLGFEVTISVPGDAGLNFAALESNGIEIMYQTRASLAEDIPVLADEGARSTNMFFAEVEDLDAVVSAVGAAVEDLEVVVPRRKTFYGMEEVFVRAPCGSVVGFAQPVED